MGALALLFTILFCQVPARAQQRPFGQLSVAQVSELLRFYVAENPDLKKVWDYRRESGEKKIFLTGSALRGMLNDIHDQAITGATFRQIKDSCCRRIRFYLPKDGSLDVDIVYPDHLVDQTWNHTGPVKRTSNAEYDPLATSFHKMSAAFGGASIQNLVVNPDLVYDPDGAMSDAVAGYLTHKTITKKTFEKLKSESGTTGFTMFGALLRSIRYQLEMPYLKLQLPPSAFAALSYDDGFASRESQLSELKTKKFIFKTLGADLIAYFRFIKQSGLLELVAGDVNRLLPWMAANDPYHNAKFFREEYQVKVPSLPTLLAEMNKVGYTYAELQMLTDALASGHLGSGPHLRAANRYLHRLRSEEERICEKALF